MIKTIILLWNNVETLFLNRINVVHRGNKQRKALMYVQMHVDIVGIKHHLPDQAEVCLAIARSDPYIVPMIELYQSPVFY